jgi:S1-C subfamily serine protease
MRNLQTSGAEKSYRLARTKTQYTEVIGMLKCDGRIRTLAVVAVSVALLTVGIMLAGCPTGPDSGGGQTTPTPTPTTSSGGTNADVVGKIKDAVVRIDVDMETDDAYLGSSGSGFVVTENGRIVTCAHVVDGTVEADDGSISVGYNRKITVIFHSGTNEEKKYAAEIVRQNDDLDLALLKVDFDTPVFLTLADSDKALETTAVMAAGYPLGLEEISIREGTVSAHRVYEGAQLIEHTVPIDQGNSGGPILDKQGRVVGINSWAMVSALMGTKFAVPSNVLRDWLASDPDSDPAPLKPGATLEQLLTDAGLKYTGGENGVFDLAYEGGVTVRAHQVGELMRLVVYLGRLESGDGEVALQFNYTDPLGRLAVDDDGDLCWEAQVPMSFVTPKYLRIAADAAATQAGRWSEALGGAELDTPDSLYPSGDKEQLTAKLQTILDDSEMKYERDGESFEMPYDNDISVYVGIWHGLAVFSSFTGGMPGDDEDGTAAAAIAMLERNYDDPLGRLSLDEYNDVTWEAQIPMDYLTSDYLSIIASVGAAQAESYIEQFGRVPFNEKSD